MSEGIKRPYAQVLTVANAVADMLRPYCLRVEIAGSVRRQKAMCTDIEIVAIPRLHTDLLGEPLATSEVDDLLARIPVTLHKNGAKYKQFSLEWQPRLWFKVDLFLQPDPATWGVNFLLRTGSPEFSKRFVTARSFGGLKPDAYMIEGGRVWQSGKAHETREEADVFRLWGMEWIEPKERL